ncbi:GNAT family N-acetyltransferase [Phenylobacterium sp.]|uniref:GNAT family N-acetyltransferase n=1 Tax=Phenylobacterium sp. TaxID=1871053 RepID=UPI00273043FF|nr:GNAT family N-acetyltransferase [Phenylobacterium sp.]MDP1600479.1 GNAT family N-acetyltransferase [Phenylobacterium sp.]MDP3593274.1 GNAT family N-acetyltransferase [Phenylobacterium sp.]
MSVDVIETLRLRLRPLKHDDLDALSAITSDPSVMTFVGDGAPLSRASTAEWIANAARSLPETGFGSRAVVHCDTDSLIGWAGLVWRTDEALVELIYGFGRQYWGQGFATEAARALVEANPTLAIDATIDPSNAASRRILDKLAFAEVATELDEDGLPTLRLRRSR